MSAKNVRSRSLADDAYFTPRWVVDLCVEHIVPEITELQGEAIALEPSAGAGVFLSALASRYPAVRRVAVDINAPQHIAQWGGAIPIHGDFLDTGTLARCRREAGDGLYDLVIGNPPFTHAQDFIEAATPLAWATVFLVRLGFLASERRVEFFRRHRPAYVYILPQRPSFTGTHRTDSADYCFVAWLRGYEGPTMTHWLPAVPLDVRRAG